MRKLNQTVQNSIIAVLCCFGLFNQKSTFEDYGIVIMEKKFGSHENKDDDKYEKPILALIAFSIILLVSVQSVILNNGSVLFINTGQNNQGTALEKTVYLYEYGFITLELQNEEPIPELCILKNGEKAGDFSSLIVRLEVVRGDIIEIDSTNVRDKVSVRVANIDKKFSRNTKMYRCACSKKSKHY